ncbi:unnamed protein product [Paramecium octaurelia]|uniref:Asparagine synthetase domain-containing protein n=1 Tax=Paramecium octaurelia TaxID=43137 RepID=A0A8S1UNP4_PAROT|nr:unnamed protein product [Paramecium octaurelia]
MIYIACLAWGIEIRLPFMFKSLIEQIISIDPNYQMIMPSNHKLKIYIKKAFEDLENPFVQQEILWRQKEQFSDGMEFSKELINQAQIKNSLKLQLLIPRDKEQYWFRQVYTSAFPIDSSTENVSINNLCTHENPSIGDKIKDESTKVQNHNQR